MKIKTLASICLSAFLAHSLPATAADNVPCPTLDFVRGQYSALNTVHHAINNSYNIYSSEETIFDTQSQRYWSIIVNTKASSYNGADNNAEVSLKYLSYRKSDTAKLDNNIGYYLCEYTDAINMVYMVSSMDKSNNDKFKQLLSKMNS